MKTKGSALQVSHDQGKTWRWVPDQVSTAYDDMLEYIKNVDHTVPAGTLLRIVDVEISYQPTNKKYDAIR